MIELYLSNNNNHSSEACGKYSPLKQLNDYDEERNF